MTGSIEIEGIGTVNVGDWVYVDWHDRNGRVWEECNRIADDGAIIFEGHAWLNVAGYRYVLAVCPRRPEAFDPERLRVRDRVLWFGYHCGKPIGAPRSHGWEDVSCVESYLGYYRSSPECIAAVDYCAPREETEKPGTSHREAPVHLPSYGGTSSGVVAAAGTPPDQSGATGGTPTRDAVTDNSVSFSKGQCDTPLDREGKPVVMGRWYAFVMVSDLEGRAAGTWHWFQPVDVYCHEELDVVDGVGGIMQSEALTLQPPPEAPACPAAEAGEECGHEHLLCGLARQGIAAGPSISFVPTTCDAPGCEFPATDSIDGRPGTFCIECRDARREECCTEGNMVSSRWQDLSAARDAPARTKPIERHRRELSYTHGDLTDSDLHGGEPWR